MSAPSFFIITITRNNQAGLQATLDSLRSQSYAGWRACVIDGASTDGTVAQLQALDDPRLNWQSEKDNGIYDAMNKGIRQIPEDADYVLFMNGGDCFENPQTLANLAGELADKPDLLIGASRNVDASGTRRIRQPRPLWWRYIGMPAEHQAMVFSSRLLRKHPFNDRYRMSGDYEQFCRLLSQETIRARRTSSVLCRFAIGGVSVTRRAEAEREDWQIRREILNMNPLSCLLIESIQRLRYRYKKARGQA